MSEFKKYRRTQIAEMRPVNGNDMYVCDRDGKILFAKTGQSKSNTLVGVVSISQPDMENGSPKIGDMIARNPKNHDDQWLVAEQYYKDNFEPIE